MAKKDKKTLKEKKEKDTKDKIHNLQLEMRQAYASNNAEKATEIMWQIRELRQLL